ncbi:MAG TPA: hypothetical protein VFZ09_22500 [Archangium sp.]|uniref:hypothetical protein n=1 Tax=Archangium sp. TaxID=1872627 RepID=UPI002E378771|nr:hypothetical protein [Archangium sp.]HEX5749029.1 hypothetical protein [Archangium sp.]
MRDLIHREWIPGRHHEVGTGRGSHLPRLGGGARTGGGGGGAGPDGAVARGPASPGGPAAVPGREPGRRRGRWPVAAARGPGSHGLLRPGRGREAGEQGHGPPAPGPTPFQEAARYGHLDVMRQLITAGADEEDGEALEGASRDCRPEAVKLLLGQGGWRRKTPLLPETVARARRLAGAAGCEAVLRLLPSP